MRYFKLVLPALLAGFVAACGGGGGDSTTTTTTTEAVTLSGTAAAGAPIIGSVTVKGALGNTKSALIEANGNYNVDVTGLTAPYRLRAEGTVGGRTYKLHSYAVAGDVGNTVNITPFTDLIVANVAGQIAESYFDTVNVPELTAAEIDEQETELQEKLKDIFAAAGVDTAIDLLNSTFSADHSGLDAALDLVNVTIDTDTNIATITNLVEGTSIEDNLAITGETEVLEVVDATKLTTTVSDTQALASIFDAIEAAFANGLPTAASIENYFSTDFYTWDQSRDLFLTEITTDPSMVDNTFSGITVRNIDTTVTPNTAEVTFSFGTSGIIEVEPVKWFAAKDDALGWQVRGDQRIVETDFSFHCNDYDGDASFSKPNTDGTYLGDCGVNTRFWDKVTANNSTGGAFIASGTVEIIDSTTSEVKATIYLGTPTDGTAGDVQAYSTTNQNYQGDWISFSEIAASNFLAGDTIRYKAYTEVLDLTNPAAPAVTVTGTAVATYTDTILFEPETVLTKMPTATAATKTAMQNFTLGSDLTVAWTLAADTRNEEVLLEISDSAGNRFEIWDWTMGTTSTSKTFSSSQLSSTAASDAGLLSTDTTYNLKVRIYAENPQTGQSHSRDYDVTIPGPAATSTPPPTSTSLTCDYETPWDEINDVPTSYNSFTEFESVITACGNEVVITEATLVGTWLEVINESNGSTTNSTYTFSGTGTGSGTGTWSSVNTGIITDSGTFNWVIQNGRLVMTGTLESAGYIDISVALSDGTYRVYSEDYDYGAGDLTANGTADGIIFPVTMTKQ